ncbi:MAG: hypothetical protein ACKVU4_10605 [Phycisphaerales bacterium]
MARPSARILASAATIFALAVGGGARADVIYQNTFESGPVEPVWSAGTTFDQLGPFSRYIGRYSNESSVTLTLPAPSPAALGPGESYLYTLTFDLYVIDSWDGYDTGFGPDWFRVHANGTTVFDETFANMHTLQSFRPPDVGPIPMGYHPTAPDSIYRDIAVSFGLPGASTLSLKFGGHLLQGMSDESWGLDNVRVASQVIPTPGAIALLGLAGLTLVSRRRSRCAK